MNRALLLAAAAGSLAIAAPALAQPFGAQNGWQPINARQQMLDQRIDVGVRSGTLTRDEAVRLRAEYRTIADLEARYRATNGLDRAERDDLDRRFDLLSQRIRIERADNQVRPGQGPGGQGQFNGWQTINARQQMLDQRIDQGVRNGSLTRDEAVRLRAEFRTIADLENRYRLNGLDLRERADLDRRFDLLSARIRFERADNQDRGNRNGIGNGNGQGSINARQNQLERRIERAVQRGALDRREAARLRGEFQQLAVLESRYRASGGLDRRERADLDQRFDQLEVRLRVELADRNFRWDDRTRFQ